MYVRNVTLENLRLIRGDSLFYTPDVSRGNQSTVSTTSPANKRGYSLFVSTNCRRNSDTIGMRLLGLRQLAGQFLSWYIFSYTQYIMFIIHIYYNFFTEIFILILLSLLLLMLVTAIKIENWTKNEAIFHDAVVIFDKCLLDSSHLPSPDLSCYMSANVSYL